MPDQIENFPFEYIYATNDPYERYLRYVAWRDSTYVNYPDERIQQLRVTWERKDDDR